MLCFTCLYLLSLQPVLVLYVKSDCQSGSRPSSRCFGAPVVLTNGIEPLRGVYYAFGGLQYRGSEGECRTLLKMILQSQMHNNREETLFSQSAERWICKNSQYLLPVSSFESRQDHQMPCPYTERFAIKKITNNKPPLYWKLAFLVCKKGA